MWCGGWAPEPSATGETTPGLAASGRVKSDPDGSPTMQLRLELELINSLRDEIP